MKKMFLVMTAIFMIAETNATPPATRHGLLKPSYQGYFEKNESGAKALLEWLVIKSDQADKYLNRDISGHYHLVMTQLSYLYIQDKYSGNEFDKYADQIDQHIYIEKEKLLGIIDRLQPVHTTNFYASGKWESAAYNAAGDQKGWNPGRTNNYILCLDGDLSKPGFDMYCMNNVIPGPNYEPEKTVQNDDYDDDYIEESNFTRGTRGANTNNNYNYVYVTGQQQQEQRPQVIVLRQQPPHYQPILRRPRLSTPPYTPNFPVFRPRMRQPMCLPIMNRRLPIGCFPIRQPHYQRPPYQPPPVVQTPRRYNESRPGKHQ